MWAPLEMALPESFSKALFIYAIVSWQKVGKRGIIGLIVFLLQV